MTPHILLAFKNPQIENPGACHAGLGVTASNTAMALREMRLAADPRPISNGEYLWAQLAGPWKAYTHVVLEAPYIDSVFLGKLVAAFPGKQFALVYHSNLGFLSVDRFAAQSLPKLLELTAAHPNFRVAGNCRAFTDSISLATGHSFLYLPNLYHLPSAAARQKPAWRPPMPLHVGLFGACRVLKNWLTAAVATAILQRKAGVAVSLHVNSGRDEGGEGTESNLKALLALNPGVTLVECGWFSSDDFRRYLFGMDLLLQPSFTETFNNVTADGASIGIPSVISDAITWAPAEWVATADSAADVAATAWRLLHDTHAPARGWHALDTHNRTSLPVWEAWLS